MTPVRWLIAFSILLSAFTAAVDHAHRVAYSLPGADWATCVFRVLFAYGISFSLAKLLLWILQP